MKVVSRLAKMDFKIGTMERKDDQIMITSHPSQPMKTKVYISPQDAVELLKAAFNWSVISFVLTLPFIYFKSKRQNGSDNNQRKAPA
jgi:hypothetical protein